MNVIDVMAMVMDIVIGLNLVMNVQDVIERAMDIVLGLKL